ncbi:cat eye syndrome critical region protein 2-like [Limulus polyphemus]|uniref:Cat eye syndrome critical region protein 2-like n=1 Tax=Limulus polyphemus TaxID=6850 RepID=A0ABM1BQT2_LIMPO|nr:cat eye syndrome critical region protein 2-like [Limulus polyphemus]
MYSGIFYISDIQSWWEVPSIAHFCYGFRAAFGLFPFEIEELEQAFLLGEDSFLQDLIIKLLQAYYQTEDISSQNWEEQLRDLFQQKWVVEERRFHPFPLETSFASLSLRTQVEIVHALCEYCLDVEDVTDALKGLEADHLRAQSLGRDGEGNEYWYFYGTRLYKETKTLKNKSQKGKGFQEITIGTKHRATKKQNEIGTESYGVSPKISTSTSWSLVCCTQSEWQNLANRFKKSKLKGEKNLAKKLITEFLPVLEKLEIEKEKTLRKRLLEMAPRRVSSRIEKKRHQQEKEQLLADTALKEKLRKLEIEEEERRERDEKENKERKALERAQRAEERMKAIEDRRRRVEQRKLASKLQHDYKEKKYFCENVYKTGHNQNPKVLDYLRVKSTNAILNVSKKKEDIYSSFSLVLSEIKSKSELKPFLSSVDKTVTHGYYSIIQDPIDLSLIEKKVNCKEYSNKEEFLEDIQKTIDNFELFSGTGSVHMSDGL